MKQIVFYSWQSDLAPGMNRYFIERALKEAAEKIQNDVSIEIEPVVERDVEGVPGSPDIALTIVQKIEASQVFVCDVSLIGTTGTRFVPNPNVLLELGYAINSRDWSNIIMVFNKASGNVEDLPFDLKTRRVVCYEAHPGEEDRSATRKALAASFEAQLRSVFASIPTPSQAPVRDPVALAKEYIENNRQISLRELLAAEANAVIVALKDDQFSVDAAGTHEEFARRVAEYERIVDPILNLIATGFFYDTDPTLWIEILDRLTNPYDQDPKSGLNWWYDLREYPNFLLFSAAGVGAVAAGRYGNMVSMFKKLKAVRFAQPTTQLAYCLANWKVNQRDLWNTAITKVERYTPVSDRACALLRDNLKGLLSPGQIEGYFDRYEYLYSLYVFATMEGKVGRWGPIGSYVWRNRYQNSTAQEVKADVEENLMHPMIKTVPGSDGSSFIQTIKDFGDFLNKCRSGMGIF